MDKLEDFEPLDYYNGQLRAEFEKNAAEYFDGLVKRSGVDVAANAAAVKKYEAAHAKEVHAEKQLSSGRLVRGLVIFLTGQAFAQLLDKALQFVQHFPGALLAFKQRSGQGVGKIEQCFGTADIHTADAPFKKSLE